MRDSDSDSDDGYAVISRLLLGKNNAKCRSPINRNAIEWSSDSEDEDASTSEMIQDGRKHMRNLPREPQEEMKEEQNLAMKIFVVASAESS